MAYLVMLNALMRAYKHAVTCELDGDKLISVVAPEASLSLDAVST